ncbi:60S ribosomal protein L10a-2 [Linum grandiflorum]
MTFISVAQVIHTESSSSDYFICNSDFLSKLQSDSLREAIATIITRAQEKPRKFIETVELQIGLNNYDPLQDKRSSGSVKLPQHSQP